MYGIAMSVAACLRGGTRVDVAWNLDPTTTPRFDPAEAVGITPGGGKLGELLGGALDSRLIEVAAAKPTTGRVLTVELSELEAQLAGAPPGSTLRVLISPADALPEELWDRLLARVPVDLVLDLDGDRVTASRLDVDDNPAADDTLVTSWEPRPTLVVLGAGPIAAALGGAATYMGWNVEVSGGPELAIGLAAGLSAIDGIVVMGHDTEAVGRVLQAALGSNVGYIGSIGPQSLQDGRRDWLAYRGITDTSRVHGPAGLPLGGSKPEEIAVSVIAEMIADRNASVG